MGDFRSGSIHAVSWMERQCTDSVYPLSLSPFLPLFLRIPSPRFLPSCFFPLFSLDTLPSLYHQSILYPPIHLSLCTLHFPPIHLPLHLLPAFSLSCTRTHLHSFTHIRPIQRSLTPSLPSSFIHSLISLAHGLIATDVFLDLWQLAVASRSEPEKVAWCVRFSPVNSPDKSDARRHWSLPSEFSAIDFLLSPHRIHSRTRRSVYLHFRDRVTKLRKRRQNWEEEAPSERRQDKR